MIGHHIIFCAYGFWLPNDPRGSWSEFVGAWELLKFGPATKTTARRSVAHREHDGALRMAAKEALRYPAVHFNGEQAAVISYGFRRVVKSIEAKLYACSILPEHVHVVTGTLPWRTRYFVNQLKGKATESLEEYRRHPFGSMAERPTPWARNCWDAFLDTPEDMHRAMRYVRENPGKEGLREQRWDFERTF